MAAVIGFYAEDSELTIHNLAGSGLGFFGAGFGASVQVGEWQDRTFITNGDGTVQGAELENNKFIDATGVTVGQAGTPILLTELPNYQSTLNIRFTYDTAVQVNNAYLWIYDRINRNNDPTGVTTKVAEIIHPDTVQNDNGSGDATWLTPHGSGVKVSLAPSPGISGIYAGDGSNSVRPDTRHDWYTAISASPDSVGSKTYYAAYVSLEFL